MVGQLRTRTAPPQESSHPRRDAGGREIISTRLCLQSVEFTVAYWDAVWALYSRDAVDVLTGPDWSHGTTDRRDAFLRAAVDELV